MYCLGLHVVRCLKSRRPVRQGRVAARLRELIGEQEFPPLRSRLPALWSESYFAATVSAVSAARVERYTGTRYERPWRREKTG